MGIEKNCGGEKYILYLKLEAGLTISERGEVPWSKTGPTMRVSVLLHVRRGGMKDA